MAIIASNGLVNFELSGAARIQRKLDRLILETGRGVNAAVERISKDMYNDVFDLMSGKPVKGLTRESGANNVGAGVEIRALSLKTNAIGVETGRLRRDLAKITQITKNSNVYTGRVGFPQNYFFTRRTRAVKNRIKWPAIRQYTNVVITPKARKLFDPAQGKVRVSKGLAGPRESPQTYGPRVLLGSEKLYGRNVLRMSLFKVMGSFNFVTAVEDNVKIAVLTAGRPTPSLGRGD